MTTASERRRLKFEETNGVAARAGDLALIALACGFYVAARVWGLDAACLWFDEIFGLHAAAWHGWGGMWRFVALDLIHPPLFYVVLKVWVGAFGAGSVWWLRMLPVVASSLAIFPVAMLARELRLGARTLGLALLLAAVSGTLVKYAQELRMYSLLWLFAACSLWLFARYCDSAVETRRAAVLLFVANLLLVYTHYFGWLVVALEVVYVALFARVKLKVLAASFVALAACFAPWAWAVWRAASDAGGAGGGFEQNLGWAARPGWRELFELYLALHEPFRARQQSNEPAVLGVDIALAVLIFAPPLAALCRRTFTRRANADDAGGERDAVVFLIFFAFAPACVAFALAQVLPQSVWGARHLIVVAPAYLLLAAHALESLRPRWLSIMLKLVLGCWLALAAVVAVARRAPVPVWCAWEPLAVQVARDETAGRRADGATRAVDSANDAARAPDAMRDADGGSKIYAFEDLVAYQLWYALRARGEKSLRVAVVRGVPGVFDDRAFFLPRGFDEVSIETVDAAMREERFWVALRGAAWDEESSVLKILSARGYETAGRFEFAADGQKAFVVLVRKRLE
jgi:hypothetical protein